MWYKNTATDSEVMMLYVALHIFNWDDQGCGFLITTINAPALPVLSGAIYRNKHILYEM
jgi:hypothetical protein